MIMIIIMIMTTTFLVFKDPRGAPGGTTTQMARAERAALSLSLSL